MFDAIGAQLETVTDGHDRALNFRSGYVSAADCNEREVRRNWVHECRTNCAGGETARCRSRSGWDRRASRRRLLHQRGALVLLGGAPGPFATFVIPTVPESIGHPGNAHRAEA